MENFAKRITRLRRQRQLTQKDVADALEIPLSTYKEWEYGRRIQGEEIYARLAEVLSVDLRTLLTGEGVEHKDALISKVDSAIANLMDLKKSLLSI